MPQQAVANGIGHSELRRAQLTTFLSCVVRILSGSCWVSITLHHLPGKDYRGRGREKLPRWTDGEFSHCGFWIAECGLDSDFINPQFAIRIPQSAITPPLPPSAGRCRPGFGRRTGYPPGPHAARICNPAPTPPDKPPAHAS